MEKQCRCDSSPHNAQRERLGRNEALKFVRVFFVVQNVRQFTKFWILCLPCELLIHYLPRDQGLLGPSLLHFSYTDCN